MHNKSTQKGFTLIELIIVIVILGILAVTAAPKFIDISSDAKKARHDALSASIKTAASLAFSKCLVSSSCSQSGESTVDIGGGVTVEMLNGWPKAHQDTGIGLLIEQDFAVEVRSESNSSGAYTSWLISWPDRKGLWWAQDCTVTYSNYGSIEPQINNSTAFSDVCEN